MPRHSPPARTAGLSGRALVALAAFTAALLPAVFLAPQYLAANGSEGGFVHQRNIIKAAGDAFVGYWGSGRRDLTPGMQRMVDYWFRFHVVKAGLAAILLIALVVLGRQIWTAYVKGDSLGAGARAGLVSAGVLVLALGLLSLVLVVANVQGAIAPFTSVETLVPVNARHGQLAVTLDDVRRNLSDSQHAGQPTRPPLATMISDNARYHRTLVVISAILATASIGICVVLWKRIAGLGPADRCAKRTLRWFGALSIAFSLVAVVLFLANMSNAAHPAEGLAGFFGGGH
jgi:hypothetical protein